MTIVHTRPDQAVREDITDKDMIDEVARALHERRCVLYGGKPHWATLHFLLRDEWRDAAKDALATTAAVIEERYGSLHPGTVCIRAVLKDAQRSGK